MSPAAAFAAAVTAAGISLELNLQSACAFFFGHEGVRWDDSGHLIATGLVDNPNDPGGVTNFGISLKLAHELSYLDINHDGVVDARDIDGMHLSDAIAVLQRVFWVPYGYGELPGFVAIKLLDLAANTGPVQAHKIAQRACRAASYGAGRAIADDGVLGAATRAALINCDTGGMASALRSEAAGYYRELGVGNAKASSFLTGWLNRAYD